MADERPKTNDQRPTTDFLSRMRSYFVFVPLVSIYTTVLGTISLLLSPFDRSGRIQHALARTWSRMIMATIMSPVRVEGLERLVPPRGFMLAVNHVSALDIPVVYATLPFQFRIIAKTEVFRRLFIGGHLRRSGQIEVNAQEERDARRGLVRPAGAAPRGLDRAVAGLRHGMPLVVFPEGGRSRDGSVRRFRSGVFRVAIEAGVDVVPVALLGMFELLPMQTYHVRPRPLEMRIGKPIPTKDLVIDDARRLAKQVQTAVEELYDSRPHVLDPRIAPGFSPVKSDAERER